MPPFNPSFAKANLAVQCVLLNPSYKLMAMSLDCGGYLTNGSSANISGKYFKILPFGIDRQGNISYENVRQLALKINLM